MNFKTGSFILCSLCLPALGSGQTIQLPCEPGHSDLAYTNVQAARDFAITTSSANVLAVGDCPHHFTDPGGGLQGPNWPCYWNWTGAAASNPVILPQPYSSLHVTTPDDDYYVAVTGKATAVNVGTGGNLPVIVGYLTVPYSYTYHLVKGIYIVNVSYWTHAFYWADSGNHSTYANPVDIDPVAAPNGGSVATSVNDATVYNHNVVQIAATVYGKWSGATMIGQAGIYTIGAGSPWLLPNSYQSTGLSINKWGNICGNQSYYTSPYFQPVDPGNATVGFVYYQNFSQAQAWSATTTYANGNIVEGSDYYSYRSLADNNLNHDPSNPANLGVWWARYTLLWDMPGKYVPAGSTYTWTYPTTSCINNLDQTVANIGLGAKNSEAAVYDFLVYYNGNPVCHAFLDDHVPATGLADDGDVVGNYWAAGNTGPDNWGWGIDGSAYITTEPPGFDPTPTTNTADDCATMNGISLIYNNVAARDTTGPVVYAAAF